MQNEKNPKNKKFTKPFAVFLAVTLLVVTAVGGTLAWLTDSTPEVANTFTIGNIDVSIAEKGATEVTGGAWTQSFKMIPGHTIDKEPIVTVEAGSEDCWVFLKVHESPNLDSYILYTINTNNWTQLTDENGKEVSGVFYCKAQNIKDDRSIKVLGEGSFTDKMGTDAKTEDDVTVTWNVNQVAVKPSVTKEMMEAVDGLNAEGKPTTDETKPTLSFTASAVQYWQDNDTPFDPYVAWGLVPGED